MSSATLAEAALALVGCRFRLHGRDPATGLDCVGVVGAALNGSGRPCSVPTGYTLRWRHATGIGAWARTLGFRPVTGALEPGDVVVSCPGPDQFHLAIAVACDRVIEAHAGLRRVVVSPAPPASRRVATWRLAPDH